MTKYLLAPAQARAEHALEVWLRTDTDDPDDPADSRLSETGVRLEFLDTSGGIVLVEERPASLTASWQRVDIGPTAAPPGTAYARVRVTADATGPGATFYVDSVRLTASPAPPAPTATTPPEATATAPPEPTGEPPPVDESVPTFFASLMNGGFELPGKTPWGWSTHAAHAVVWSADGSRLIALTSKGGAIAWLHQSFAVQAGRWYEASGRLRTVSNASLARIRVAWYASEDASGAQLSTADSEELSGVGDSFAVVSTGVIRAPDDAQSARLRVMLLPAGPAPAVLHADDVSFARTAPPPPRVTPGAPTTQPSPTGETAPSFFPSLTNGDFELPGDTPYGWRAHAADALVASEGGSRLLALTSRGGSTAWVYQSFAVEGGRWYEAAGRLRPGSHANLARIRVAWYASEDASGAQLSTTDSEELTGADDSFLAVSTGRIRAPDDAESAQLRIMLRPASGAPAILHADDVSFARTAPLPAAATDTPPEAPSPTPEAAPSVFSSLTNGDFELPGDAPYGWRAHAGDALVTSEGGSRLLALTSRGSATTWLRQSFAIEGGRWYEAAGRLRPGSDSGLARIRIAWYASEDGSGPQLATADSDELSGSSDLFAGVSTGRIRAPDDARSAQLRIMLRPAGEAPAVLHADDVSFARTAPPPAPTTPLQTPGEAPSAAPEAAPTFFAALTNGDFELPGNTPYGWRAHAGAALVATEGGSRAAALISRGRATAWLHQSFAVEGGRWYEAGGRLRAGLNAGLARIRIAWYASEDASGAQLSTTDSEELGGGGDAFASVSTGAIRAPEDARSAQLRVMLQPAGEAPALLHADEISFARTAPPPAPTEAPAVAPSPTPEAAPAFFASLTNGDFELPGEAPYGWRAHAGAALVTSEGGSRAIALTSEGDSTAWLHQSFAVEGGRWYEANGRLWPGANADLARIRVAWYASEDASGAQLSTGDSEELVGVADAFAAVSTGAIRAPDAARSAQLRIMLRPSGEAPAVLRADDVAFASTAAPQPAATPEPIETPSGTPSPASEAARAAGATATPAALAPAAPAAIATPTLEPYAVRSASAILLRITELLPDPLESGADAEYEWIEVSNVGRSPVSLDGLFLADNHGRIALPALALPPAGALVVAGPQAEVGDAIAVRHGRGLFNGLGNSGDRLALATADGAIIDALSWGSDDSVDQPPLKAPAPGRSLQRRFDAAGRLTEATVSEHPSPGRIEPLTTAEPVAPGGPVATSAAAGEVVGPATREAPSSVEALRKQLDDAADWNRTAWIVLLAIAAVALAAAAVHRTRELLRAPPPARRAASPRRTRRWRRYASGLQVRRRREPNRRQ